MLTIIWASGGPETSSGILPRVHQIINFSGIYDLIEVMPRVNQIINFSEIYEFGLRKSKKVKLCFGGAPVVYTVPGLNALYPGGIPYQSAPMLPGVGVYFLEAATAADWEWGCGGRSPPPEKV